ncbi:MAG: hypothetical protein JJV98_07580 [Desulfosarcina sp.]|nr:hypothetical protein [Desulfobacterales bacterium]
MIQGANCRLGKNLNVSSDTKIGDNVEIGNNVTIYPQVCISNDCRILDGAVIGRMPITTGNTTLPVEEKYFPVMIGSGCVLGCHCVLYTGVALGAKILIGDQTVIREKIVLNDHVVVGQNVSLQPGVRIGKRSRVYGHATLGKMIIEENVFIGPGVNSADDNNLYLSRFGLKPVSQKPVVIKRLAAIGMGANILPGIVIGEGAFVAAGALASKDIPPWTMVAGVPAKHLRDIPPGWRKKLDRIGF